MSRQITKGATDQSTVIRIVDSTDGTPETGVTSATTGLDLKYRREGAAAVALTESDLASLSAAHSDGGMFEIGAGYYRVDLPDAACATGVDGVLVFGTVTGMVVIAAYHELVDAKQTGDGFARLGAPAGASVSADIAAIEAQTDDIGVAGAGLTGIPWNAAWDVEVQSEVADALAVYDPPTNAEMVARTKLTADYFDPATDPVILAADAVDATALSADASAEIADAVLDEATSGHVTAGTLGKAITDILADTNELQTDDVPGLIAALDTLIDAIKAKTDSLTFTQAGHVDSNVQRINDVALTGNGTVGTEWGP